MGRVDGKIALVTGGARGLGYYDCIEFVKEGASVIIIADIREEEMEQAKTELQKIRNDVQIVNKTIDVTSEQQWKTLVQEIDDEFGKLDILVNNAGITHRVTMMDCTLEDWQKLIDVNQTGVFLGMKYCAPLLRKAGKSSIINISSIAGLTGYFAWPYTATKWAVTGMTQAAAMEFSDWGIRVNSVHPGFTWTDMTKNSEKMINSFTKAVPHERAGNPEEIAKAVLFLASEESSFISGVNLPVDGGLTAGGGVRMITKELGIYQ